MSGPALKHVDSHTAIHEAALNEAIEMTNMLDNLYQKNQKEEGLKLAYVLVEQWETRRLPMLMQKRKDYIRIWLKKTRK